MGFDSHFLGYRHAGYYLPDYLVVQFPEIPVGSGTGVFLMQSRDTRSALTIPRRSYKSFVLFPLPSSPSGEYHDYIDGIRGRFPGGELKTILERGCRFDVGPISALPLLFPSAALEPSP